MSNVRARCVHYETCFVIRDGYSTNATSPDPVETALSYPILKSLKAKSFLKRAVTSSSEDQSSNFTNSEAEEEEEEEEEEEVRLRDDLECRSRFTLHLSPKQRTRILMCTTGSGSNDAVILSPISDKSETTEMPSSASVAAPHHHNALPLPLSSCTVTRRRPALSLFNASYHKAGGNHHHGSDSGISAGASAASSQEALLLMQRPSSSTENKTTTLSLNNSHEFLEEESLPFLMPKLHRSSVGVGSGVGGLSIQLRTPAFIHEHHQMPVSRQLSLPFSFSGGGHQGSFNQEQNQIKETTLLFADVTLPIESQRYYHGSITRRDAEKRLEPEPAGSFLVRDSLASRHDYFLAARGETGFVHVLIRYLNEGEEEVTGAEDCFYSLATLPDRRFPSVMAAINHCANIGLYSRLCPPLVLKYPLNEDLF